MAFKSIDISGERYGRLTAVKKVGVQKGRTKWLFHCDCGNDVVRDLGGVRYGKTRSCGCLHKEMMAKRNCQSATHGESRTRLYAIWRGVKERCLTTTHKDYKRYGAKGITICEEWRDSYPAFKEWAFANGYDPEAPYGKCTLDRIDNSKGYSPDNCRWVDAKVQASNRKKGYEIYNLKRKN